MTLFDVSCFGKRREMHESLNNEPAQAENVEIRDRRSGEGVAERESEGGTEGAGTLAARNALPQESRTAGRHRTFALHEADDRAGLRLAEGAEPVQIRVADALQPPLVRAPGIDREPATGLSCSADASAPPSEKKSQQAAKAKNSNSDFRIRIGFPFRKDTFFFASVRTACRENPDSGDGFPRPAAHPTGPRRGEGTKKRPCRSRCGRDGSLVPGRCGERLRRIGSRTGGSYSPDRAWR